MTFSSDPERTVAPPGWYGDPWQLAAWRWYDGTQWTGATSETQPVMSSVRRVHFVRWPAQRAEWVTFVVAAAVGLAIWIPTAAMQPRVSFDRQHPSEISEWYLPLMLVAALVLGAIFARRWPIVAVGLMVPQFALALFTTPQGDDDGLWMLIFPMLAFLYAVLLLVTFVSGLTVNHLRERRLGARTPKL